MMSDSCSPGAGFPRRARLLLPHQFRRCFESGQRLSGRYFRLHLAEIADGPRLGLAVSRKVSKRAVGRNRIKRLVRESFRHVRAALPSVDLVLLAKPDAATAPADQLRADLAALWRRLSTLKHGDPRGTMRAGSAAADRVASPPAASAPAGPDATGASTSTPE